MHDFVRVLLRVPTRARTWGSTGRAGRGPAVELVQFGDGELALMVGDQIEGRWPPEQVEHGVQALRERLAG